MMGSTKTLTYRSKEQLTGIWFPMDSRKAAVSAEHEFLPIETAPRRKKCIFLTRYNRAVIGEWYEESEFKGWFPMPDIPEDMKSVHKRRI